MKLATATRLRVVPCRPMASSPMTYTTKPAMRARALMMSRTSRPYHRED